MPGGCRSAHAPGWVGRVRCLEPFARTNRTVPSQFEEQFGKLWHAKQSLCNAYGDTREVGTPASQQGRTGSSHTPHRDSRLR